MPGNLVGQYIGLPELKVYDRKLGGKWNIIMASPGRFSDLNPKP